MANRFTNSRFIGQDNQRVQGWLRKFVNSMEERVINEQAMQAALDVIGDDAIDRTPIDTGALRESQEREVTHAPKSVGGRISYNNNGKVPYAIYVHEMAELNHPVGEYKFLEKAFNAKKREALETYAKIVKIGQKIS